MKNLFKRIIFFIVIVSVCAFAAKTQTGHTLLRWMAQPALWMAATFKNIPKHFASKRHLLRQNKKLKKKIDVLMQERVQFLEWQKENERLRRLVRFQEDFSYPSLSARVMGRDPTRWFEGFLINKGKKDGVKLHMPVASSLGLVGHIAEVAETFSKVRLIVDQESRVGGILQESREIGVLKGRGRHGCQLEYLSRHVAIQENETVLTSGLGSFYPKGLVIGKVSRVFSEEDGLYQNVDVEPAVDFSKLEEVLVLMIEKQNVLD